MSDAEVAEANGEAMDGVDEVADAQTPGATTQLPPPVAVPVGVTAPGPKDAPKGDDFEKMVASAAELVK